MLERYGMVRVHLHGCMYGLVSEAPKTRGVPIKKPWTFATKSPYLQYLLPRLCDGSHAHTPCQGTDTRKTEGYTGDLVAAIHRAWALQVFDDTDYLVVTGNRSSPSLTPGRKAVGMVQHGSATNANTICAMPTLPCYSVDYCPVNASDAATTAGEGEGTERVMEGSSSSLSLIHI